MTYCSANHRTLHIDRGPDGVPVKIECMTCRDQWRVIPWVGGLDSFGLEKRP